uniref:Uncharacterized protein n=1 Tax=Timema bartmani TaxID=61472 RepID=A0A7R9FBP5_9NEOP|nr:unnamed protein product [Timema bartmani]
MNFRLFNPPSRFQAYCNTPKIKERWTISRCVLPLPSIEARDVYNILILVLHDPLLILDVRVLQALVYIHATYLKLNWMTPAGKSRSSSPKSKKISSNSSDCNASNPENANDTLSLAFRRRKVKRTQVVNVDPVLGTTEMSFVTGVDTQPEAPKRNRRRRGRSQKRNMRKRVYTKARKFRGRSCSL